MALFIMGVVVGVIAMLICVWIALYVPRFQDEEIDEEQSMTGGRQTVQFLEPKTFSETFNAATKIDDMLK